MTVISKYCVRSRKAPQLRRQRGAVLVAALICMFVVSAVLGGMFYAGFLLVFRQANTDRGPTTGPLFDVTLGVTAGFLVGGWLDPEKLISTFGSGSKQDIIDSFRIEGCNNNLTTTFFFQ